MREKNMESLVSVESTCGFGRKLRSHFDLTPRSPDCPNILNRSRIFTSFYSLFSVTRWTTFCRRKKKSRFTRRIHGISFSARRLWKMLLTLCHYYRNKTLQLANCLAQLKTCEFFRTPVVSDNNNNWTKDENFVDLASEKSIFQWRKCFPAERKCDACATATTCWTSTLLLNTFASCWTRMGSG